MNLFVMLLLLCSIAFAQKRERDQDKSERSRTEKSYPKAEERKNDSPRSERKESKRTEPKVVEKKQTDRPLAKAVKSSVKSERRSKGRLSRVTQSIENKVKRYREEKEERSNGTIDYGYIHYGNSDPYLRDYYSSYYRPYPGFIGDINDIIYVIDGRYPYVSGP
ncbi:MAG: hypothetical protein KDD94_12760, partial [Calditrichaeota bacterium]|nr:hypothetical protein [Calditrichota bacterium]